MQAIEIPFVKLVGIEQSEDELSLAFKNDVQNHIKTIHASAQFTLAETKSGLHLQQLFPDLIAKVIPVLRESKMKYKRPALKKIIAYSSVKEEDIVKFQEQFTKKSRGSIEVNVEIRDIDGVCTAQGSFGWFIQAL